MDGYEETFKFIKNNIPTTWVKDLIPQTSTIASNISHVYSSIFFIFSSIPLYKKILYSNVKHRLKTFFSMPESKIILWKQKGEHSDDDMTDDEYSDEEEYNNEEDSENEYTDDEITEQDTREDKNLISKTSSSKSKKTVSTNNDKTSSDKNGSKSSVISLIKKKPTSYNNLTEYWKRRRWKKYLKKVDNEWQLLNLGIENVIKKMIERNNVELEKWKTQQANKWLDSNHLYAQYALLYKKTVPSIEIDNIIEQMGNKLKEKIYNRWSNLQAENENNIRKWVIEQWNEWKNAKIISWLMCDWKRNENEKWVQWKHKYRYHFKHAPNRDEYQAWQKRTNIEKKQWSNWVRIKEDHYIYNIGILCNKEKNIYKSSIVKWINDIVDKFVKNPQLRLWIEEQQDKPFPNKKLLKGDRKSVV